MLFKAYKVKSDHRKPSLITQKSQWTISEWCELSLFTLAKQRGWIVGNNQLWSIYIQGGKRAKIGEDPNGDLFIAKYITDINHEWHGYPVDPRQSDIPPEYILDLWLSGGLIDKTDKSRIKRGKF